MNRLIFTYINNIPISGKHTSMQTSSRDCLLACLSLDHCLLAYASTNTQAACVMLACRAPCSAPSELEVSTAGELLTSLELRPDLEWVLICETRIYKALNKVRNLSSIPGKGGDALRRRCAALRSAVRCMGKAETRQWDAVQN